jgi:hypothetical protein
MIRWRSSLALGRVGRLGPAFAGSDLDLNPARFEVHSDVDHYGAALGRPAAVKDGEGDLVPDRRHRQLVGPTHPVPDRFGLISHGSILAADAERVGAPTVLTALNERAWHGDGVIE